MARRRGTNQGRGVGSFEGLGPTNGYTSITSSGT